MADAHANFAYSLVATAPSPASSGTSLVVTAGQGALFPATPFNVTIWPTGVQPTAANAEICRVTNVSTNTFTITRAQEGSSARTILVGDQIAATITKKTLTDVESPLSGSTPFTIGGSALTTGNADALVTGALSVTGAISAFVTGTEHKIANSWPSNTLAIQNTSGANDAYSSLRFLKTNGDERCAIGWGNTATALDLPFAGAAYFESSSEVLGAGGFDVTALPPPLRIVTSGLPSGQSFGYYCRVSFDSDLVTRFFDKTGPQAFSTAKSIFEIDAVNSISRASVDVSGGNAFVVKNRNVAGYSAIEFDNSSSAAKGYLAYANASAGFAPGVFYLATQSTNTTPVELRVVQFLSGGASAKTRASWFTDGSYNLYNTDGTTLNYTHNGTNTHAFTGNILYPAAASQVVADGFMSNSQIQIYLDESGNNLKVRVKYSGGTLKTATIALT